MTLEQLFIKIADAIRNKEKSTDPIKVVDFDTRISNLPTGIDTSDATATENDILKDKTAYVDGQKIIGNLEMSSTIDATTGLKFSQSQCTEFPFSIINTDNITDFNSMLSNCTKLTTAPTFTDTSKVEDTSYMFSYCTKLETVPNFDTHNVNDMSYMFHNCKGLTSVPNFDTQNVTNMGNMFYYCNNLISAPNFDTQNVTNMGSMFHTCTKLAYLPQYDTRNVTDMGSMIYNVSGLTSVPELQAGKVTRISSMCGLCANITSMGGFVDLGKAYTQKTTNYSAYCFDISKSTKLTRAALMNIINKLYDLNLNPNLSVDGVCKYTQKITLGTTLKNKLTSSDIAIATAKGWTIA